MGRRSRRWAAAVTAALALVTVGAAPAEADGPPAAPTSPSVSSVGSTVTLTWTDASTDETGFEIQRARNVAGSWGEWAAFTAPANTGQFVDTPVADGLYAYLLRSFNPSGLSGFADPVVVLTVSTATTPPAAPTALSAFPEGSGVELTWNDTATNELGYEVLRARNAAGVWSDWTPFIADKDATDFRDQGVDDGLYAYLVRAYNTLGSSDWAITVVTVATATAPPPAPTGFTVTPTGAEVALSWTDNATDEIYHDILRARFVEGEWTEWTGFPVDRNATSATDHAVPDGQYAYLVRATNTAGSSDWAIVVTTVSSATLAPSAPSGLTAAPQLDGSVRLEWVDNADGDDGELWFDIQRAEVVGGTYTNFTTLAARDKDATTFTDTSAGQAEYAYLVRAHNPIGDSDWAIAAIDTRRPSGELWAWGIGLRGQRGDGSSAIVPSPKLISTDTDWSVVAAGEDYTLAIRTDGSLWGWGENQTGQLGDGTLTSRTSAVRIGTDTNWSMVAAGRDGAAGIRTDGTLWTWGNTRSSNPALLVPRQLGTDNDWGSLAAGGLHFLALKFDGSLWAWGQNNLGQLGDGTVQARSLVRVGTDNDWSTVAAGATHSLGIRTDGSLWAWGDDHFNQLGDSAFTTTGVLTPIRVGLATEQWASISAGDMFSIATRRDGSRWQWGTFPLGTGTSSSVPSQLGTDTNWSSLDAGAEHSAGIRTDATLWTVGTNSSGQLGDGTLTNRGSPVQIAAGATWLQLSAGSTHTIAIRNDGTLWAWGSNNFVQTGDGSSLVQRSPRRTGTASDWIALAAGTDHTLAVRADGTLWATGDNDRGQVGDGSVIPRSVISQIGTGTDWVSVAAGDIHSLGIRADGSLWGWGNNNSAQLGDSQFSDRRAPARLGTDNDWAAVTAGDLYSIGLRIDGTLWAWGVGNNGELGTGTARIRSSPFRIGTDADWASVSAGARHTVAIKTDGSLWTWGFNGSGQLGDGTTTSRNVPTRIGTDNDWAIVVAGVSHTVAIKTDGSLWVWGGNTQGQLGDGTTTTRPTPTRIGTAADWVTVAAGDEHTIAARADGTLWAWGSDARGAVGTGNTTGTTITSPTQIAAASSWPVLAAGLDYSLAVKVP